MNKLEKIFDYLIKKLMIMFNSSIKPKHVYALLKYSTPKKFLNLLKVQLSIILKLEKCLGYPYLAAIEPTNICNLKCPYCPTGQGLIGRKKQNMSFDNFKIILDQMADYLYIINFYNWGEPLLNKDIFKMIRYSKKNKIYCSLSTNGNYNEKLNSLIVDSKLNHILFSLDGSNQDVYAKYRVGGSFEKVVKNIKEVIKEKKLRGVSYPFVEVQFIVFKHNEKDIENFKKLVKNLGVDGFSIVAGHAENNKENMSKYYVSEKSNGFCKKFWYSAVINCDGGIVPCCYFFYKRNDFGNLLEQNFSKLWNSRLYRSYRKIVAEKRIKELPKICQRCMIYHPSSIPIDE